MEIPCCLSLFVEKTVTQFSSCTKSSGSRDTELCSNLPWNSLKNFIEVYGFIFINTAVYLKSSLQKEVIKDFHSGIQGREYPWDHSRNWRSRLPDIELVRKERKTETNKQTNKTIAYPPKLAVSKTWKQYAPHSLSNNVYYEASNCVDVLLENMWYC